MSQDYLMHYGVKGMKWGVRHDPNTNYGQDQRRRDRRVYGNGGVKRINKHMNRGETISGARSIEADRINNARRRARVGGQVGNVVGSVGGGLAGLYGSKYVVNYLNKQIPGSMNDPAARMIVSGAVSAGAAKVGQQLGRYGGQSISMIMSGYNYSKFR